MENQIKKALIIKSTPIDKILAGTKTWEMRSTPTKLRGRIGLIKSKSGKIWGQANLVDCLGPLTIEDRLKAQSFHQITPERLELPEIAKYNYAWVLEDVEAFATPRAYIHPPGAVIWVNLS